MEITIPQNIIKAIFSSPRKESKYIKGKIQKIEIDDGYSYQISLQTETQIFHKNVSLDSLNLEIKELLTDTFMQLEIFTEDDVYGYRVTSKGKLLSNKRTNTNKIQVESHNREKNYLLKEGMIVPPLVDLGVMTPDGKIVKKHYDKFKQINRFLEMIEDSVKDETKLSIIDFGCGKSYLTFILYYYLKVFKKIDVTIVGLDLKSEVINECNLIRTKYGYENLSFEKGDIADYINKINVDMVISLHACDTATDYAIYNAITHNVKYLFSVPCCQHEINFQVKSDSEDLIKQFGILKERYSAILTDAIRGQILKAFGYKVQILEFIDMLHSPKNLLIRAVKTGNIIDKKSMSTVGDMLNKQNINQTLFELLKDKISD